MNASYLKPQTVYLLVYPGFSLVSLGSLVEPFRAANELFREQIYTMSIVTEDGRPVRDANHILITPTVEFDPIRQQPDIALLCTDHRAPAAISKKAGSWLAGIARHGARIGAVGSGTFALARFGLLNGYRCSVNRSQLLTFRERFPDVEATNSLYEIDRNRMTAVGGIACIDLILSSIAQQHGQAFALKISDMLAHPFIRPSGRQPGALQTEIRQKSAALSRAIRIMERHLEEPLGICEVADMACVSVRQMQRLFKSHLRTTPTAFYLAARLQSARHLLLHSEMSVREISIASGFGSASNFTKVYKSYFKQTPTSERHQSSSANKQFQEQTVRRSLPHDTTAGGHEAASA